MVTIDYSRRRSLNGLERLMYGAAGRDQRSADRVAAVGSRTRSPLSLLTPAALARAVVVNRRARATPRPVVASGTRET
ncbi:hypothetical protein [Mycolicibacterium confluentis]|uniref:Uncharacterized protein n=1 Tax=Mycolicibacterium confluentis TaxID=28047 RepID=A0A7I7Y1N1_9MYCO|nr:hypothetical protein [Mycolicibacterium confluentis]MCV7320522.1 hypothetical protein [Mycolicibacterium confluentis]ORV30181.1 hypothetical protein AWB99_13815 [Mycolicibacterium confluentis]BBZ35560.1 hypothetical protein MCNF_41650 [Mycolicibacterium confluentis]